MRLRQAEINGQRGWCVDYGVRDGKRRREYFMDERKAVAALKQGQKDAIALGRKWANIEPHERLTITGILAEIRTAGLTLRDVWDAYRQGKHMTSTSRVTVRQAIDDLIASKTSGNKRPSYITNLRQVLDAWSRGQDHRSLASITLGEIETHVASRAAVGTRLSAINRLSTLFSFAVRKGWLAVNPCERIERPTIEAKLPTILSNADAAKMLAFIRVKLPRFVPWFALSLFGGLRPEEADQITWSAVNLDNGSVLIDPSITKVRNARTVHLEPVAVAWLKLGGDLPIPKVSRRRAARMVRDYMGWEDWPKDVLRHSCASHLIALKKSYGAVALEMGNSEQILRKHYRAEVPDDLCKAFWALTPAVVMRARKEGTK